MVTKVSRLSNFEYIFVFSILYAFMYIANIRNASHQSTMLINPSTPLVCSTRCRENLQSCHLGERKADESHILGRASIK